MTEIIEPIDMLEPLPDIGGVAQPGLDGVGARLVAVDDRPVAGLRPAAVAVGDDRDEPRPAGHAPH